MRRTTGSRRAGLSNSHVRIIQFTALALTVLTVVPASGAIIADHTRVARFDHIPAEYFDSIREGYRIYYGHTSHGGQIMTGLDMLHAEDPTRYVAPEFSEYWGDLGHNGDTSWVQTTRDWLDAHPEYNVVMWAWCGGCSDNTEAGVEIYLNAMSALELVYPEVVFIYMTGHLDGGGPTGDLYLANNQIREYCQVNDKVLFDFADIESWDPDGNYYPDDDDGCGWCYDWCASHPCPSCDECAHTHCFNCYLKGKSFWWLMAAVDGWTVTGVGDSTPAATFFLENNVPNPFNPSTEIRFTVSEPANGSLAIYSAAGDRVSLLHDGRLERGSHRRHWDGRDDAGRTLPAGTYFCRLQIGRRLQSIKMTLLK